MPPKPQRHRRYNGAIIRQLAPGRFQAEINHGGRHRLNGSEDECKGWIDATMSELDGQNKPLTQFQIRDAREALALLPAGASLAEAARAWAESRQTPNVLLADAADEFLTDKRRAGLRDKSMITLRSLLGALEKDFGATAVAGIDAAALMGWLAGRGLSGETRDNYRRTFSSFFGWAIKMGYCRKNPAAALTPLRRDDAMPGILSPRQCWRLLHAAERAHPEIVPYLALGLFAGIRPAELSRLDWKSIGDTIHIGASAAKTRQQRFVTIQSNLKAWLAAYRREGPVLPYGPRRATDVIVDLRQAAKIPIWPADALRHSFATYHLALFKDAALTSHELGHGTTAMLFSHYRALASEKQGRRFYEILPSNVPKNQQLK